MTVLRSWCPSGRNQRLYATGIVCRSFQGWPAFQRVYECVVIILYPPLSAGSTSPSRILPKNIGPGTTRDNPGPAGTSVPKGRVIRARGMTAQGVFAISFSLSAQKIFIRSQADAGGPRRPHADRSPNGKVIAAAMTAVRGRNCPSIADAILHIVKSCLVPSRFNQSDRLLTVTDAQDLIQILDLSNPIENVLREAVKWHDRW